MSKRAMKTRTTLRNGTAMVRGTKALGARLAKWRDVGPSKEGINPTSAAFKAGRRVSIGTARAARNELQYHVAYCGQDNEWFGPTTAKKIRANKVLVGDVLIPWQNNNTIHDTVVAIHPHGKKHTEFTVSRRYVGETFAYDMGVIHGSTEYVKVWSMVPRAKKSRTALRNGARLTSGPIVHGTRPLGARLAQYAGPRHRSLETATRNFEAGEATSRKVAEAALVQLGEVIRLNAELYHDARDAAHGRATYKMLEKAINKSKRGRK